MSEFDIESGVFPAASIATIPCLTERLQSYEDQIPDYQGRDFTYMPMPYDEKYYNTEEGWLRDIHPEQYVSEDTHLIDVLKRLQSYPFLLLDYRLKSHMELFDSDLLVPSSILDRHSIDHDRVVTYESALNIEASEILEEMDFDYSISIMFAENKNDEKLTHTTSKKVRSDNDGELLEAMNVVSSKVDASDRFGIITISDLNRRPMKEMIYRALSELEITISKNIESEYSDSRRLFKPARPDTIGRWEKDQIEGLGLHIAEYMTLIELQQSLKMADETLVETCGFDSKKEVDDLSSINTLRNKVMHTNRTLIHNRRDIKKLLNKLDRIEDIINNASAIDHW